MKKILFTGFMASILSIAGAYAAATDASLTTKGYVDAGLRWAKGAADTAQATANTAVADAAAAQSAADAAAQAAQAAQTTANNALTTGDIIDNLTSTSTTDALSANQGRVLDGKITTAQSAAEAAQATANTAVTNAATAQAAAEAAQAAANAAQGTADNALTTDDIIDNLTSSSTTDALSANQGRVLDGKITTAQTAAEAAQATANTAVTNAATAQAAAEAAQAAANAAQTTANNALTTGDIIDNLTSTSTTDALSANQGRVLDSKITAASTSLTCENGKTCVIVGSAATPVDAALADDWVALTVGQ